jgi:hypothetical protein
VSQPGPQGPVGQRADLTFKHNRSRGRHGWLRLTPAYSLRLVSALLDDIDPAARVFDPFSGTATTALCAAQRGHQALALDINPFLVWLGRAKLATYRGPDRRAALSAGTAAAAAAAARRGAQAPVPPIHNPQRWWAPLAVDFLQRLKHQLDRTGCAPPARDLLSVAFCRTLMAISNADFGHQSVSFLDRRPRPVSGPRLTRSGCAERFCQELVEVVESAAPALPGRGRVNLGDARRCGPGAVAAHAFDLVVTSPPYPNRISYIRELRPYMYWLGYLTEARQAGELDWQAIGGTWGVATSRLQTWTARQQVAVPAYLTGLVDQVRARHPRNGPLLANYVARYFEDVVDHLRALRRALRPGARVHYIVGNSSFYGVVIPVERVYADLLDQAGYRQIEVALVRKRNSKKELFEFAVSASF